MRPRKKSPFLAVLLSLIPGLGHLYAGEAGKGVLLFLGTTLAGFLMVIVPGLQLAFGSLSGAWTNSWDFQPLAGGMTVAATASLYVLVIGPALVIYSMASSHRSVVRYNEAVDAGGLGSGRPGVVVGSGGGGAPAGDGSGGPGSWTLSATQTIFWGLVLTILGALLVLPPLLPGLFVSAGQLWPLLLVVLGLAVIWGVAGNGHLGRRKE